jgi:hypothetical protein
MNGLHDTSLTMVTTSYGTHELMTTKELQQLQVLYDFVAPILFSCVAISQWHPPLTPKHFWSLIWTSNTYGI